MIKRQVYVHFPPPPRTPAQSFASVDRNDTGLPTCYTRRAGPAGASMERSLPPARRERRAQRAWITARAGRAMCASLSWCTCSERLGAEALRVPPRACERARTTSITRQGSSCFLLARRDKTLLVERAKTPDATGASKAARFKHQIQHMQVLERQQCRPRVRAQTVVARTAR